MPYEELRPTGHHLILEDREHLTVSGVEEVESFDESTIVMDTAQGVLIVRGEGLHIEKLSLDGGDLKVEGDGGIPSVRGKSPGEGRLPVPAAGVSHGGVSHWPGPGLFGSHSPGTCSGAPL